MGTQTFKRSRSVKALASELALDPEAPGVSFPLASHHLKTTYGGLLTTRSQPNSARIPRSVVFSWQVEQVPPQYLIWSVRHCEGSE